MLVRFFRSHQPVLLLIIPLLAAVLWLPGFLHPATLVIKHQMPLFEFFTKPLLAYPWAGAIVAFLLLLIQAFLFNYILYKYEITGKSTYLPVFIYLIFTSFSPALLSLTPLSFAGIFVLLALNRVLAIYRNTSALSPCFDAGFLVAIASLFYFPAVVLLIFLLIAVLVLRPFSGRELLIVLLGFLLPYIYVQVWYFVFVPDGLEYLWIDKMLFPIINHDFTFNSDIAQPYGELALFAGLAAVLSIGRGSDAANRSVQHRSNITVLRWLFIISAITLLFAPNLSYTCFYLALIPILILITNYFLWARIVWLSEIILWVLVLTIVYNHYSMP